MNKNKFSKILSLVFSLVMMVSLFLAIGTYVHPVRVNASTTYETPDYISVSDLMRGGKPVGNKVVLDAHKTFTYNKTAKYGSVVFSFVYKNTTWKVDDDGSQFHFYNTWQMNGMFWLRPDKVRIAYTGENDKTRYAESAGPITAGTHDIELGRLAVMDGDKYTGDQYFYLKVDGVVLCERTISDMDSNLLNSNGIFTTGTNGNAIFDSNWEGSKVTYLVNGEIFKEENTTDDYLTKPATDPVMAGKKFVGWYDEMGREWNFATNPVTANLTLRAGFVSLEETVSDEVYFDDSTYTPVLRFMVSSDVHFGSSVSIRDTNLGNAIDAAYSIANSNPNYKGLDATLFAGDISDSGNRESLVRFRDTAKDHLKDGTELIVSMGNHDFRSGTVEDSMNQFQSIFGYYDKHLVINGYHFIIISPDMPEGLHFSDAKVEWLDTQLAQAAVADPTKPIFVMQHEHIADTVYGSINWNVTELTDVLCKYPQVVDFSGHSHYPLVDPRSIWQGTFTALGTGTLHYYEMGINGYKTTGVFPTDHVGGWSTAPNGNSSGASFLVVEIDANNAIRVIVYDLVSETEVCRYYIRNVMDEVKFTYSHIERAKNSVAPQFDNDANLELTAVKTNIKVKFDQATGKDPIDNYRVNVYQGSELIRTEYVLSDYFIIPTPQQLEYTISGLKSDTQYKIEVYAVNVWGDVSPIALYGSIKTEYVVYEPERYAPYDLINVADVDYPDNTGILADVPSESKQYDYPGTSPSYTAAMQFYLITGDLTSKDEFRIQIGNVWTYYTTFWIQTGKYDVVFMGWIYSTRTTDRYKFAIESNKIYKIEFGTVLIEAGEHQGEGYAYLKIDDKDIAGFYIPFEEFGSNQYKFATHITDNYKIADIRFGRNIEYYVDNTKYEEQFAISGLNIKEPKAPTKEGEFFVGWYTDPVGGSRVDFSQTFSAEEKTVKYYARFTDSTYNVYFYSEGDLVETQIAGKDCQILPPKNPVKTGTYKYSFVNWAIKGTDEVFDFNTRIQGDLELEARFEEQKYRIVYLVDGKEFTTRHYIESNPTEIIGREPEVPQLLGAVGHWEYVGERKDSDIYARAIYDGIEMTSGKEISLNKFNGGTVDIADDLTRFYLSFADTEQQAKWLESYTVSGGHERQDITFSWTDSSRNMSYLVYFADNENFENAFIVRTDTRSVDYVGIFTPGQTYYWKVVGLSNDKCSEVDSFTVLDTPVRWISAGTVFNVRDSGGWTTTDGNVLKYGMIYRGGQLSIDQPTEKSYMDDYAFKVFDYLRLKTEIELRGDMPHDYNQFNELENLILVSGGNYMGMFSLSNNVKAQYREVFAQLADISNYPFYFHCSWGADRTGSLGFLINGVLGVPYEQLAEDYELTSLSYSGSRTRYTWGDGAFQQMYEAFMTNYAEGGTIQDAITNYLILYIGVTQEQINSLKAIMLSPAESELVTHTVTYLIDGEVYQNAYIFDGETIKEIAPLFIDKHLDCWLLNGEPFDVTTKVTTDLVLVGRFATTLYEDYDIVTVRDLGLGESYIPTAEVRTIEGTVSTGGRMFVFDYQITANDGKFDDGVHVEIGPTCWDYRAHMWICDLTSIHIFTEGSHPIATYNYHLEYGRTYRFSVGVIIPIDGIYAGKKMFLVMIDGEVVSFIQTTADISSTFNIGLAGTEGVLRSIENKKTVTFVSASGEELETKQITRGQLVESIGQQQEDGKIFLGWFDELGNIWNFENDKVLKDMSLFAKFGDRTINAVVIDEKQMEIQHGYKVKIGIAVSEIGLPLVPSEKLVFDGWYNGATKLNSTDIITEDMNLICIFKIVEEEPINPEKPDQPENPEEPKAGCKAANTSYIYLALVFAFVVAIIIKKKRYERN